MLKHSTDEAPNSELNSSSQYNGDLDIAHGNDYESLPLSANFGAAISRYGTADRHISARIAVAHGQLSRYGSKALIWSLLIIIRQ